MWVNRIILLLLAHGLVPMINVAPSRAEPDLERGRAVVMGAATTTSPRSACHTCHGMHGAGDSSGAFPRLSGQAPWYLYKQLKDYASGERRNEVMSPIAQALSDQQMEDVAAYYAAQESPAEAPLAEADALLLQRGAAIAAAGLPDKGVAACVNCHGPSGRGLPPSFPYLAGQYAPYIELQFRFWKEGARHNDPLGVMQHIAQQLSEDEINALASYFASMPPPSARPQETARE
jgi:cytochrome c553